MRVLIFGATGMVGQGVLRECLTDAAVRAVVTIGRSATGVKDPKLERELVRADLFTYRDIEPELADFDACFFCLGVSSGQVSAAEYERLTYGLTMAAGVTLARLNPGMTFVYVSGAGTDGTEKGRLAWARVKGRTENALMRLPFRGAYMLRPGIIQPVHGEVSRTRLYRFFYQVLGPVLPLIGKLLPKYFLTTAQLGQAMIRLAARGGGRGVLESWEIRACATGEAARAAL